MKRSRLVCVLLAVLVALPLCLAAKKPPVPTAPVPQVAPQPPGPVNPYTVPPPPPAVQAAPQPCQPAVPASPSMSSVVTDLVAVLAETKSEDVYTATVLTLGHMGTEAAPALPVILKNAERLGILDGAFTRNKSERAEIVLQALAAIAQGQGNKPVVPCCAAGSPVTSYALPTASASQNVISSFGPLSTR
jgi:hypothetical protein